jgi:Putative zinc-finger
MTCKEIKYYLNDYADGHLINEIRNEIADHLDYCANCKKQYLNVISILKEASALPKEITSRRDIQKLINEKPRRKKTSLKILSINQLDNYFVTGSRRKTFTLKKKYRKSGWFFASAVIIAIVLGIVLGILYYSQYLNN